MSYQIPRTIRAAIMAQSASIAETVDEAVRLSFGTADLDCHAAPGEVDKVLSFFIEGLDFMEEEFNRLLNPRGVNVSISAIFTHQTPKVELTTTPHAGRNCELADITLLVTYGQQLARGGLGNALLLQAKNSMAQSDPVQRALYEQEVRFRYFSPAPLTGKVPSTRDLPPKFEPAFAYWELGTWPWHAFPGRYTSNLYWASQVNSGRARAYAFGVAIVETLRGVGGYGFRRPAATEYGWSRMLFDLIEVTATQAANRNNLGIRNVFRGSARLARFFLRNSNTPGCPFVVRNSLAHTLAFYSEELGALGRKIEQADQTRFEKKLQADEEPPPERKLPEHPGSPEGPPILGNDRPAGPDDDSGAGNLIFLHFTQQQLL